MFCTQCGRKILNEASFCSSCGAMLSTEASASGSSVVSGLPEDVPGSSLDVQDRKPQPTDQVVGQDIKVAEEIWRDKTDDEVAAAANILDEYTDEGRRIVLAELARRGMAPVAEMTAERTTSEPSTGLVRKGSASNDAMTLFERGVMFLVLGVAVQALSYAFAPLTGGYYLVPRGVMLYGLLEIFRSWRASNRR